VTPAALFVAALPFLHKAREATPDSAAAVVERVARMLEGSHDFYLLAGTAAVTLVGLLFVALSFHLDALVEDSNSHLLAAARMAFMNFVYVLLLSLFFLMPSLTTRMQGVAILLLSAGSLGYIAWNGIRSRHALPLTDHERFLRRRFAIAGFVLGMGVVTSILFVLEPQRTHLMQFMAITCVMLVNAAGTSWDLLVQVGRIRRARGQAPAA
jgi:hypothetical protein